MSDEPMRARWLAFITGQHPQRDLSGIVAEFAEQVAEERVRAEVRAALAPREPSPELAKAERWLRSAAKQEHGQTPVILDELERLRAEVARLSLPAPAQDRATREGLFFGKDCPVGMVQIEFVGCSPSKRCSDYGWKPVEHAFLEVYVDGKRYRIDVGDYHDGHGQRRGMHIITDCDVEFQKTAINACSLFTAERAGKDGT